MFGKCWIQQREGNCVSFVSASICQRSLNLSTELVFYVLSQETRDNGMHLEKYSSVKNILHKEKMKMNFKTLQPTWRLPL